MESFEAANKTRVPQGSDQAEARKPSPEFESYRHLMARLPRRALPDFPADYRPRVELSGSTLDELTSPRTPRQGPAGVIRLRWHRVAAAAAALLVGSAALIYGLASPGNGMKAAVVYAGGEVLVMQPASAADSLWPGEDLSSGSILGPGAMVMTGPESAADIALADGVVLRLKENTRVKVERLNKKRDGGREFRIAIQQGRLLAVAEGLGRMDEFKIITPDAFAEVRQTAVRISADDNGTTVYLMRGGMELRSRAVDAEPTIVEADQVARVQATDRRPVLAAAPGLMWTDNRDSYELSRRITNLSSGTLAALGVGGGAENSEARTAEQTTRSQVELKDGSRIDGQVVGQIGRRVMVQSGAENMSLSVSDIKGIEYLPEDGTGKPLY